MDGSIWEESPGSGRPAESRPDSPTSHRVPHPRCHPEPGPEVLRDAQHVPTETEPALLRIGVGEKPSLPWEHRFWLGCRIWVRVRHLA